MSPDFVVSFLRESIYMILALTAPILGISLITGLIVSILQAVTQIHESTLTFVPKMVVTFAALLLLMPWIAQKILKFTVTIFTNLPSFVK
ncbi:MAG: flagellar biosynthesis protein FliQ [Candidatus Firestonebacteria bacterium]|nr:flagellar biosynthesis protein FliQ [Candidatus Firestonebacteria bacterium]